MPDTRPTCSSTRRDGQPCRAPAMPGKDVCTFHDPELASRRAAGRRSGGQARSRQRAVIADAPDVAFGNVGDVTTLLAQTATQTRRGTLDPKVASVLAYLASVALRSLVQGDIEQRLAAVEQALAAKKGSR